MSGIDEVLERIATDQRFREQVREDPVMALSGYVLYDEDLEVLASNLREWQGSDHGAEPRTDRAAFLAALTGLAGGPARPSGDG